MEITIDVNLPPERQFATLIHECIHAIERIHSQAPFSESEVEQHAMFVCTFLRDNPQWVPWAKKVFRDEVTTDKQPTCEESSVEALYADRT